MYCYGQQKLSLLHKVKENDYPKQELLKPWVTKAG